MNFQLAKIGHSFKGSMAYYLHDKRQDGEQHATTAERVAWTETRNLATDGPHTATRIMIATAQQADELKAAAGVKTTGRKATAGPVFSFSLQWRADELPDRDRAEMTRAADHALKVLKLDHLQAVIVCHQDQAHPHVHVIVNRVDPENGKQAVIRKPDVQALDRWANRYEHERGQVVSPNRAEKYAEQGRRRRQHPDPQQRREHIRKRDSERRAERKTQPAQPAPIEHAADRQAKPPIDKTPAAMLKELGAAQQARHRQEWAQLAADQKRRRQAIYDAAGRHIRDELARAKEQGRPLWSQFLRFQRDERRQFEARERTLAGKIRNCIAAAKIQERRGEASARGFLSMAFAYVGNRDARRRIFAAEQKRMRQGFAAEQRGRTDQRLEAIKQARSQTLAKSRQIMTDERGALIERHDAERAKVREAWRQLNLQRGRTPTRPLRENPTMRDFDKAAGQLPDTNRQKIQPATPQAVATPAPALAPAGMPQPSARTVQNVPRVDQAAAWAKTEQGRAEMAKHQPAPPARSQFDQARDPDSKRNHIRQWNKVFADQSVQLDGHKPVTSPEPAKAPAPAQQTPSQQTSADFWGERLKAKAAEMSRDQSRDKSHTRNRDQDQDQEPKM